MTQCGLRGGALGGLWNGSRDFGGWAVGVSAPVAEGRDGTVKARTVRLCAIIYALY